jgi:hypothetical protein
MLQDQVTSLGIRLERGFGPGITLPVPSLPVVIIEIPLPFPIYRLSRFIQSA